MGGDCGSIGRGGRVRGDVPTGAEDEEGEMLYGRRPVVSARGEEGWVTEYIVPPEVSALCEYLGIDRSTWANYRDPEKHPELAEITDWVYDRMKAWNERELLTRPGKDIKGIVFNLENNYGYREKHDFDISSSGVEEYLKKLSEDGEAGGL